MQPAVSTC